MRRPGTDATAVGSGGGAGRSTFAARFTAVVGEPPLSYLTGWRVTTAGNLLSNTDMSIGRIAQAVGYGSEAAFRRAFVSRVGVTPRDYRREHYGRSPTLPASASRQAAAVVVPDAP